MLVSSILLTLAVGLPLALLACMLCEWLSKHMEQQEAIFIQEILAEHSARCENGIGGSSIKPVRFWHFPKLSILNASCVGFTLFAISVAIQLSQTGIQTSLWTIWGVGLVVLAFVDARTKLLPDVLTLPLLWLGIVIQLFPETRTVGLELSVIGAVAGYLPLWLFACLYKLIRGRDGLGMGDLKLLAAMGVWSGPFFLPQVLLLAALLAIAVFIIERMVHRSAGGFLEERPFGPAIVAAYFIVLLFTR
jgi:prepilin signal peptidase PulO-like enzyme (type II secretory pathway)